MKSAFVVLLMALALCNSPLVSAAPAADAVVPFHVDIQDQQLTDLRNRIAATRWPDKETVADRSQGAQLAKLQELVRYWGTNYDWRKAQASSMPCPSTRPPSMGSLSISSGCARRSRMLYR